MKITLFYDHVTILDYAYLDDHKGPVGNSLVVNVEFIGETDEEGILYDFSHAKKKVKEIIDRDCDHRLVVPKNLVKREGDKIHLEYTFGVNDEKVEYWGPEEAVCEIPYAHCSYSNIKSHLEELILKEMPETVKAIRLEFVEEKKDHHNGYFHYTHGLKDHYGNCQRLFHGHRNTVLVHVNGQRVPEMEQHLINDLFSGNIHFCFFENIVNKDEICKAVGSKAPQGRYDELPPVHIKYKANQGEFEGIIPGRFVYIMQTESTVENLSMHFSEIIKSMTDEGDQVSVHAFEGIAKGAITSR